MLAVRGLPLASVVVVDRGAALLRMCPRKEDSGTLAKVCKFRDIVYSGRMQDVSRETGGS